MFRPQNFIRASVNNNSFISKALHSHSGAALQIAFHDHTATAKVISDSCDPSQVQVSEHRMMNWDYGSSYSGPFNSLDLAFMSQQVDATEDFVTYGITFTNRGRTVKGPLEIPTFYFTNNFRKYYYKVANQGQVTEVAIPQRASNSKSFSVPDNNLELEWITFENSSGVKNDVYTLTWFYGCSK